MSVATGVIESKDVSTAWISALKALVDRKPSKGRRTATHFIVRIEDPTSETTSIRRLADELLVEQKRQPIDTVRNTIFPAAWAQRYDEPSELAAYYREKLPILKRAKKNRLGLYFERIVAFPASATGETVDQLTTTVQKLRQELATDSPKSSRYELNIYDTQLDRRKTMDFPCLSFLSFHYDGSLHLSAQYRNQQIVERGYGNYLGLGQLLGYVAQAVGVRVGELLVVAGHAELDCGLRRAEALLSASDSLCGP